MEEIILNIFVSCFNKVNKAESTIRVKKLDYDYSVVIRDVVNWRNINFMFVRCSIFPIPMAWAEYNLVWFNISSRCWWSWKKLNCIGFFNAIEEFVELYGAEKLLFGTGLSIQDPGQAIAQLNYSQISVNDKELIGYKNLERILGQEDL